jgi:hypothetical protein
MRATAEIFLRPRSDWYRISQKYEGRITKASMYNWRFQFDKELDTQMKSMNVPDSSASKISFQNLMCRSFEFWGGGGFAAKHILMMELCTRVRA